MIFSEKITYQRKKNGWSQEELAEKMHVSRQAVGKWETGISVPDLEKILQLAALFGVTTDYLLKDTAEEEETAEAEESSLHRMTLAETHEYLRLRQRAAWRIAIGVMLCILSPISLLLLGGMAEDGALPLTEALAGSIGLVILLLLIAAAVVLFVRTGFESEPYAFLEKELFETEYGVTGLVKEKQKAFRDTYVRFNILGTVLCVLSPMPLFLSAFAENDALSILATALMLAMVAVGVFLFVLVGVRWGAYQRILSEGDFTPEKKAEEKRHETISTIYWLIATALYLTVSFLTGRWDITWVIWPIAGILYPIALIIYDGVKGK